MVRIQKISTPMAVLAIKAQCTLVVIVYGERTLILARPVQLTEVLFLVCEVEKRSVRRRGVEWQNSLSYNSRRALRVEKERRDETILWLNYNPKWRRDRGHDRDR